MNPFSKLPLIGRKSHEAAADSVDHEVEGKAERIAFHRTSVRNGPVTFKTPTNGQIRRAEKRALASRTKKARRAQVANHLATQGIAATVRGQLQLAGVLPYIHATTALDPQRQVEATVWIVKRFGIEDEDGTPSFAFSNVLAALSEALRFYGQAVGLPELQVPEGYVVPVYEQGTEPESLSFYGGQRALV